MGNSNTCGHGCSCNVGGTVVICNASGLQRHEYANRQKRVMWEPATIRHHLQTARQLNVQNNLTAPLVLLAPCFIAVLSFCLPSPQVFLPLVFPPLALLPSCLSVLLPSWRLAFLAPRLDGPLSCWSLVLLASCLAGSLSCWPLVLMAPGLAGPLSSLGLAGTRARLTAQGPNPKPQGSRSTARGPRPKERYGDGN